MLDASALWLVPGLEHPVFKRYAEFFNTLFSRFRPLDYHAAYLSEGGHALERRIQTALKAMAPGLLLYTQFPSSYSYISPEFLGSLRARCAVVGFGYDDEIFFEQAKFFYRSCSAVITTDITGAAWLNEVVTPAYVVATAWLAHPAPTGLSEDIPISFIGNMNTPGRREYVQRLEASGIPVVDFGAGSRNGTLTDTAVMEVFCRSKINLNFTATNPPPWVLRHNPLRAGARQIKARPFELAALGKFCLCEWAPCVDYWFRSDVDIGVFRDANDLVDQARRYLSDDTMRQRVAASARERYRAELAPDIQFTRVFSRILAESRLQDHGWLRPALGGPVFYESMGRSKGMVFQHVLRRGSLIRALHEVFTRWALRLDYWRGFVGGIIDTLGNSLRRA